MMNLRSLRPAITGLAMLASAGVVGCGTTDKFPVLPRLDVASVVSGSPSDGVTDDLAHEELVNQQINVGHDVAASVESKKPAGRTLRDRLLPGRKTSETLADFSADPFLDDLDQMLVAGAEGSSATGAKPVADAFNDNIADARQDAAAMFGPPPTDDRQLKPAPRPLNRTRTDPFEDIDLVASRAAKPAGNELETAVFGDGQTVADNEFDQFLQQSAKPLDKKANVAQSGEGAAFDPLNATDNVSLEADVSEFEPFRRAILEDSAQKKSTAAETGPSLQPETATIQEQLPDETVVAEFGPSELAFEEPPPSVVGPSLSNPRQENASVQANAPVALPRDDREEDTADVGSRNQDREPAPSNRVEIEPDPSLYEPLPEASPDPFADTQGFEFDSTPQVRTANRQVTVIADDQKPPLPASAISQTVAAEVIPGIATGSEPPPARVLLPPGEWTVWFLIGGAITVVLLLFAPGRGRS